MLSDHALVLAAVFVLVHLLAAELAVRGVG